MDKHTREGTCICVYVHDSHACSWATSHRHSITDLWQRCCIRLMLKVWQHATPSICILLHNRCSVVQPMVYFRAQYARLSSCTHQCALVHRQLLSDSLVQMQAGNYQADCTDMASCVTHYQGEVVARRYCHCWAALSTHDHPRPCSTWWTTWVDTCRQRVDTPCTLNACANCILTFAAREGAAVFRLHPPVC